MRAARSIFSGLIILSAFVSGQTAPQPDPIALLQRVRTRLLADAGRMPRYTCLQNITRHFYRTNSTEPQSCAAILAKRAQRKHDPPPTSWDRLQLDVAIADDREIHSWPDAPRFNEEEIRKLVSNGPFGSGDFSAFVAGIFGGGSTIKFEGAHAVNGRTLFEYTFAVTNNASRYQIATAGATLITAYDGSFLLDPQSADLAQLSVRTAELPEATNACQAISEIEYGRIDIHGRQVMIPDQTDLRIVYRDGREAVATTSYSSCHEYTSKAILRFDAEPVAVSASAHPAITAAATQPSSPFPAGLTFNCRIVTPIDSDTPAGRPIEAILRSPLRGKDKAILAPRGARIRGRLVRLADHKSALDYFEVGVRLESVEGNGAELPLYATLENQPPPPVNPFARRFNVFAGDVRSEMVADFPTAPPRNVGVFFFVREELHLKPFDSAWITTSAETDKEQAAPNSSAQQQAFEKAVKSAIFAINYSQKAVDLQNGTRGPTSESVCDIPDILADRRKAIEAGKSADPDILNRLYPSLGDKFKYAFLDALTLFVHGCATRSQVDVSAQDELQRSNFLSGEWAEWYGTHRQAIADAVNLRKLDSEWPAAAPTRTEQPESPEPAAPVSARQETAQAKDELAQDHAPQTEAPTQSTEQNPSAPNAAPPVSPGNPVPPSGAGWTIVSAELSKSVDTKKSKVGDKVEAKTTLDLLLPDKTTLPRDTKIVGHISNVKASSKDSPGSMVEIAFDHALLKDGRDLSLQLTVQAIGRPLPADPALTQPGAGLPSAGASSVAGGRNQPAPPPEEPPKNSNPDAGAGMPGENSASGAALNAKSEGVIGYKGLSLSTTPAASRISSEKDNVHLEKGTQLILKTQ